MSDPKDSSTSLSEAEKFLESLNLPDSKNQSTDDTTKTDPNDIMSFLDEISNLPAEDAEKVKQAEIEKMKEAVIKQQQQQQDADAGTSAENTWMSWGNNFWNQASAAVKTTTDQINKSVQSESAAKLLESRVKTLQNYVNKENIEKLGMNSMVSMVTTFVIKLVLFLR